MFTFDINDLSTMKINPDLLTFLWPYNTNIQELTLQIRHFVVENIPQTNELIWDNYNAVAIAYSKSDKLKDAFCHIAVYKSHVNFGFNRGVELSDSPIAMLGKGKLIRHISVTNFESFPVIDIKKMLTEAIKLSEKLNTSLVQPDIRSASIVMSISKNKIRPTN